MKQIIVKKVLLILYLAAPHAAAWYDARTTVQGWTVPGVHETNPASGCTLGAAACYLGTQIDVSIGQALYFAGRHRDSRLDRAMVVTGLAITGAATASHIVAAEHNEDLYDQAMRKIAMHKPHQAGPPIEIRPH
jgi:hypothetical protein